MNAAFSLKDLGDLSYFLGIEVTHHADALLLSQMKYVYGILRRVHMEGAKPVSTLAEARSELTCHEAMDDPTLCRSVVGAFQYVTITRPEIAYTVNRVCQFMHNLPLHIGKL